MRTPNKANSLVWEVRAQAEQRLKPSAKSPSGRPDKWADAEAV